MYERKTSELKSNTRPNEEKTTKSDKIGWGKKREACVAWSERGTGRLRGGGMRA